MEPEEEDDAPAEPVITWEQGLGELQQLMLSDGWQRLVSRVEARRLLDLNRIGQASCGNEETFILRGKLQALDVLRNAERDVHESIKAYDKLNRLAQSRKV